MQSYVNPNDGLTLKSTKGVNYGFNQTQQRINKKI